MASCAGFWESSGGRADSQNLRNTLLTLLPCGEVWPRDKGEKSPVKTTRAGSSLTTGRRVGHGDGRRSMMQRADNGRRTPPPTASLTFAGTAPDPTRPG